MLRRAFRQHYPHSRVVHNRAREVMPIIPRPPLHSSRTVPGTWMRMRMVIEIRWSELLFLHHRQRRHGQVTICIGTLE